ncbi:acylphosphatase [Candidatus Latescibacterota bacterium]
MAHTAAHIIARGRVQGVGFRFFTHRLARDRGIAGWVKNLPDGSVEIHAEGEKSAMEEFVSLVEEGPMFGSVSDIELVWVEPTSQHTGFDIRF